MLPVLDSPDLGEYAGRHAADCRQAQEEEKGRDPMRNMMVLLAVLSFEFDVSVGRIYCWTRIISQNVPTTIKHVWYAGEQQVAEVPLNINYPSTRTWSSKAVSAGRWRVEVVGETGEVLASTDFTVKAQPGPSGP